MLPRRTAASKAPTKWSALLSMDSLWQALVAMASTGGSDKRIGAADSRSDVDGGRHSSSASNPRRGSNVDVVSGGPVVRAIAEEGPDAANVLNDCDDI
jgi:hypothetical protein